MTDYEELIYTHDIKKKLDNDIEKLKEIREEINDLGSYRLHGKLSVVVQDLYKIVKIIELESGEFQKVITIFIDMSRESNESIVFESGNLLVIIIRKEGSEISETEAENEAMNLILKG